MAPYFLCLGEPLIMSQDTSINEILSDDDDDDMFDELPSLPVIAVPDILPVQNSLQTLLAQTLGTEDFQDVTSIKLKVIASQTNLQRLHFYLPHLIELDLTGSHLQTLRPLCGLDSLRILRVGRCSLLNVDGVFGVCGLRELYAPYNSISELGLLATLPFLVILDLQRNLVSNLHQVSFLSMLGKLRELTLEGCPVSELPGYKAAVITSLPKLALLDGSILAEGGLDTCHDSKEDSSDQSEGENGAMALALDNLSVNDHTPAKQEEMAALKDQRPATVGGSSIRPTVELPKRPVTATGNIQTPFIGTTDADNLSDSVSKLTSGGVVCGNLTAALRGKHRQRKPAWTLNTSDIVKNGLTVNELYSKVEQKAPEKIAGGDSLANPLLLASQQWREAYHNYRKTHKEKWKEEEEDTTT